MGNACRKRLTYNPWSMPSIVHAHNPGRLFSNIIASVPARMRRNEGVLAALTKGLPRSILGNRELQLFLPAQMRGGAKQIRGLRLCKPAPEEEALAHVTIQLL